MKYKIEVIEGIGDVYAEKFRAAGVPTVEALLEKAATKKGRMALAEATGISEKLVLKFANHADLMRIKGIGGQFAELLEAAGVDTVKELRHRKAANLAAAIAEVNEERHLVGRVPSEKEVAKMIDQANNLEPVMTY